MGLRQWTTPSLSARNTPMRQLSASRVRTSQYPKGFESPDRFTKMSGMAIVAKGGVLCSDFLIRPDLSDPLFVIFLRSSPSLTVITVTVMRSPYSPYFLCGLCVRVRAWFAHIFTSTTFVPLFSPHPLSFIPRTSCAVRVPDYLNVHAATKASLRHILLLLFVQFY